MNVILSLIVAFAMAFSGVGELPAVPETAHVYTLSGLTLSAGDESVTLDPALRITAALGGERLDLGVEVLSGEDVLLPVSGRLEADQLSFALSGSGKVYTLNAEALNDVLVVEGVAADGEELAAIEQVLSKYVELISMAPEVMELDANVGAELTEDMIAAMLPNAEVEDAEIEYEGAVLSGKTYTGAMSIESLIAPLDVARGAENEAVRDYFQTALDIFNLISEASDVSETPAASFGELVLQLTESSGQDAALLQELSEPAEITYALQDGREYMQFYYNEEADGTTFDLDGVIYRDGENSSANVSYYEGNDNYYNSVAYDLQSAADGSYEMIVDSSKGLSLEYSETDDAGETISTTITDSDKYTSLTVSCTVDADDGAREILFALDDSNSNSISIDGELDTLDERSQSISGALGETIEEDGSVTTDFYASYCDENGMIYDVSFQLNHAQLPYADAFAGREVLQLTGADLSGEGESAAMNQLGAEVMGLAADLLTLTADESVMALGELGGDMDADDDDEAEIDADYLYDGGEEDMDMYSAEYPSSLDEAYAAYAYPVPELVVPEGYLPANVTAFEGYMAIEYVKGEDGFTFTLYPSYNDSETLFLQPDGSFAKAEGEAVNISYNDDGSVSYAAIAAAGSQIDLYFYSNTITLEDVQAMFAPLA